MRISENDLKVLRAFPGDDFGYVGFGFLSEETGLEKPVVRIICRRLARGGLAEFKSGLWTEDGEPAGSGYGITDAGRAILGKE